MIKYATSSFKKAGFESHFRPILLIYLIMCIIGDFFPILKLRLFINIILSIYGRKACLSSAATNHQC